MPERPDLAAMTARLTRALTTAELPVLDRHGLTMWAYVVLSALDTEVHSSQGALADAIRADRTRIIPVLDDLEERSLITRDRDPADRRTRLVLLTRRGRQLRNATRRDIQRNEQRLLALLPDDDRSTFLRSIELLADAVDTLE